MCGEKRKGWRQWEKVKKRDQETGYENSEKWRNKQHNVENGENVQKCFFESAFITGNSSLEPFMQGLCAQIHVNLS